MAKRDMEKTEPMPTKAALEAMLRLCPKPGDPFKEIVVSSGGQTVTLNAEMRMKILAALGRNR